MQKLLLTNLMFLSGRITIGKTNFFEAIDWFYGAKGDIDKIRFMRDGTAEVCVEIEFSEIKDGIQKTKNEKNKTTIQNLVGENDTVRIKRSSLDQKARKVFDTKNNSWTEKNPFGADGTMNDFLPKFEYVSTQINPWSGKVWKEHSHRKYAFWCFDCHFRTEQRLRRLS